MSVIGGGSLPLPFPVYPPRVEVKATWAGDWTVRNDIDFMSGSVGVGSTDLGHVELRRRYGRVKLPTDSADQAYAAEDLAGYWVRVSMRPADSADYVAQFIGRIVTEDAAPFGSGGTTAGGSTPLPSGGSGEQRWVAYDPTYQLRRTPVSRCYWREVSAAIELAWSPAFNKRDERGTLVGNRSTAKVTTAGGQQSFVFGGRDTWRRYDMAEYLLANFADPGSAAADNPAGGPKWRLGGQADLLEDLTDDVAVGELQSVHDLLSAIISPRFGVDWRVVPVEAEGFSGFEVQVFALLSTTQAFTGGSVSVTLPANPDTVAFDVASVLDIAGVRMMRTHEHTYRKIRVLGRRIVVCLTLRGAGELEEDVGVAETLEARWDSALETAYNGEADDFARAAEKYRDVYARLGAPNDWDRQASFASPSCSTAGLLDIGGEGPYTSSSVYQLEERSTLTWLPLYTYFDYSTDPPTDHTPSGLVGEADLVAPLAWIFDEDAVRYIPIEFAGISAYAPANDWGLILKGAPNHLLGLGHMTGEQAATSFEPPLYDYESAIVTIAIESDHRLRLEHDTGLSTSTGVLEIYDPDAEMWVLAPDTMLDVDADGDPVTSGSAPRTLRNDAGRLALLMAGAIARYGARRYRGCIDALGLIAWGHLLGQVCTAVGGLPGGGDVEAVITGVQWTCPDASVSGGGQPTTSIRLGYAA